MVGFAALLKYTSEISTIGTYIVFPDYRAHGIGPKIFDKLIEDSVKEGRNMGLNASEFSPFSTQHFFNVICVAV